MPSPKWGTILPFRIVYEYLSMGEYIKDIPTFWVNHICLVYTDFSRSATRKEKFKYFFHESMNAISGLSDQFGDIYGNYGWEITHIKM